MRKKRINLSVKKLIKKFDLEIVNSNSNLKFQNINYAAIENLGLELAGASMANLNTRKSVVCWGIHEHNYFNQIGKEKTLEILEKTLSKFLPPLIVLSRSFDTQTKQLVFEVATKLQIPLVFSNLPSSQIFATLGIYLNEIFSDEQQVHGCLVVVGGVGVLIVGSSGSGKSEATLELIQKGHLFVADDAVLIKHAGDNFIGKPPEITKNFLEVRGIGFIDVKYTYGIRAIAESSLIDLVIELVPKENINSLDRIGLDFLKFKVLDGYIKMLQIPVKDGSSVGSLIEAAVSTYLARKDGMDVVTEIEKRTSLEGGEDE